MSETLTDEQMEQMERCQWPKEGIVYKAFQELKSRRAQQRLAKAERNANVDDRIRNQANEITNLLKKAEKQAKYINLLQANLEVVRNDAALLRTNLDLELKRVERLNELGNEMCDELEKDDEIFDFLERNYGLIVR